jgi:hypothetical protein
VNNYINELQIMSKLKFSLINTKGKTVSLGLIVLIIAYSYFARPIEPWLPSKSELYELDGKAEIKTAASLQSTDTYFLINNIRLNCFAGARDGENGCELFVNNINVKLPVRATYFWMPTRFGYSYRVLHTLEQDGRLIISPQQSLEMRQLSKKTGWKVYFELLTFLCITALILLVIEIFSLNSSANIKE